MYFLFHKVCQSHRNVRSRILAGGLGGGGGRDLGEESLSFPDAQVEIKGIFGSSINLGTLDGPFVLCSWNFFCLPFLR